MSLRPLIARLAAAALVAAASLGGATAKGEVYAGSGIVVGTRFVVTNKHVVDECQTLSVFSSARLPARVRSVSTTFDLAVVETATPLASSTAAALRDSAQLGEDVLVAGYPLSGLLSSDLIVTSGIVNALTGIRDAPSLIQISAPVQAGNSGGPVVDRFGNVVGVVVSKLNASRIAKLTGDLPQNVNFAIRPEALQDFLRTSGIPFSSATTSRRLESVQIAARAREYTVGVECVRRSIEALQPLRDSVATARVGGTPVPEFESIDDRLLYLRWLGAMSNRLQTFIPDWTGRKEFLQTLYFEARRAGVPPALVLAIVERLSGFRKFAVSDTDGRGYMAVQSNWSQRIGDGQPSSLFGMQVNFRFGCVLIRHQIDLHSGDLESALTAYVADSMRLPKTSGAVRAVVKDILRAARTWRFFSNEMAL